jgi:outer membrane lipoprotein-sorting protein
MNDEKDTERALSHLDWCIPAEVDAKILRNGWKALDAASAPGGTGPVVHGLASQSASGSLTETTSISTEPRCRGGGQRAKSLVSCWRTLTSTRLTKYAAVAAVVAAVILGLTFIGGNKNPTGAAWAIEQTIEALQNVRTVHIKGVLNPSHAMMPEGRVDPVPLELWATSDDGSRERNARADSYAEGEFPEGSIVVKRGDVVYDYHPGNNTVFISDGDSFKGFSPWPSSAWFEKLRGQLEKTWQEEYGKDEVTGRDSVFIKGVDESGPGSILIQFDLESKLPVRMKQWNNKNWEGTPAAALEEITYNVEISEDTFSFTIPPGAKVIDERHKTRER